jgi:hypothetical protein
MERDSDDAAFEERELERQRAEDEARRFRARADATRQEGVDNRARVAEAKAQDDAESSKEADAELGGEA